MPLAPVVQLRRTAPAAPFPARKAPGAALAGFLEHVRRSSLAKNTKDAYTHQGHDYTGWLAAHWANHPDAFQDHIGGEHAATEYKRHLLEIGRRPSSIKQALAAVELLYQVNGLRIHVKRVREEQPGEPPALSEAQEGALKRAADRSRALDAAVVYLFLQTGARLGELSRLLLTDIPLTARTGEVRLLGKGDQVRYIRIPTEAHRRVKAWLAERDRMPAAQGSDKLWIGRKGPMTESGIEKIIYRLAAITKIEGLSPHDLRHTFATRCRQKGMDLEVIRKVMGHAHLSTTARYIRAGQGEVDAEMERVFG